MSRILDALEKASARREENLDTSSLREEVLAKPSQLPESASEAAGPLPEQSPAEGDSRGAPPPVCTERAQGASPWRYGAGISLVLALALGVYLKADPVPNPIAPVAQETLVKPPAALTQPTDASPQQDRIATPPQPAVAAAPQRTRKLPSVVPLHAPDPAYAAAHPGWQRYQTQALEFRVFREQGAVKAIQVLARQDQPISLDFFLSLMGEIAGEESFKVQAVEARDGYYIERGTAGGAVEVVVYRKKPIGEIRGLVVAYL